MSMPELEPDTWYWVSDFREGDIFYPIYVNDAGSVFVDREKMDDLSGIENFTWNKAVMPNE